MFGTSNNDEDKELADAVKNMKKQEEAEEKAQQKLKNETLSLKRLLSQKDIVEDIAKKIDL